MEPMKIAGIAWYARNDWDALNDLFEDAHLLPTSYGEWLKGAEKARAYQEAQGFKVVRVDIDPESFATFCRDRGLNIDGQAREAFVTDTIRRRYLKS